MRLLRKIGFILIVILFITFTLGPIAWCFIISVSNEKEMLDNTLKFMPDKLVFDNYRTLLNLTSRQSDIFIKGLLNSLKAVAVTLCIGIPIALSTAYAFSRLKFRGKKIIRNLLLMTIVIPVFTTIIPLYDMFSTIGILDNIFWLSVVYVSSFLPMITWILSNYISNIPKEIDEAAFLDGCGRVGIFFRIIIPNSYPIILAIILMMFLTTWNQYQIPLILASSLESKPLSMVVADFTSKDMIQYGITAASGILALLPPALVAIIFRKSLILGLTQGSVKG